MQIPQTKQMVSPFAQALAYQNIIDVLDEFDEAPWDQEFILIAKYNLLINAIHDIEINTTLSVEQKQILQEKLIELEHQDKDIKQKALIERMGMPLNNNPNFNYEQWKADNGSNYRYILSQCHNSDDTIKENMKKYIIQDTSKQIENMSNDGQSIDDILTEINLYLNDRASKQNIYLNEEQKQTIYHQIFAILPESIRNACKNADELEQALKLYKNISPYIAFNEDGKPIKVSNAFNAPSPGYDSRAKQVEEKFDSFLIDYTAIHDKETCERFINGEVKHKRLDNTEEAKEAFVSSGYENHELPRLLFLSLDSGKGDRKDKNRMLENVREQEEINFNIESLKSELEDTLKKPSQRLRGVLFRLFEQDNDGFKTFSKYYDSKMEQLINHYKGKLG
jgi:hypothetical protein